MGHVITGLDYPIVLGPIAEVVSTASFFAYDKIFVLVDQNTCEFCLPILSEKVISPWIVIEIPAGEVHKNLETASYIWRELSHHQASRHSLLVCLGGGVIGDMGGWAAANYMRGIDFIQIPTTLLSMVDSSVGGKLGIDHGGIKNLIGSFKNPKAVWIDPIFLHTLPEDQIRSGYAEMLKHSLIGDPKSFDVFDGWTHLSVSELSTYIQSSIEVKKYIVQADPFETGKRKILNFGHTIGHAVEAHALTQGDHPLLHGECIAIGMIIEAHLSFQQDHLSLESLNRITRHVLKIFGHYPGHVPGLEVLLPYMMLDKKNRSGKIHFASLMELGVCAFDLHFGDHEIRLALDYYRSLES